MRSHGADPTPQGLQSISSDQGVSQGPPHDQLPSPPSCRPPGPCPTHSASHTISHEPDLENDYKIHISNR